MTNIKIQQTHNYIWVDGRVAKGGRLYALLKKAEIAAHKSDFVVKTGLIRGSLSKLS